MLFFCLDLKYYPWFRERISKWAFPEQKSYWTDAWFLGPLYFINYKCNVWSVFPFRAKPEGWFGSPGPYVHVFPSRQPALARTQGILESAQWRALFQYSVGIEGVADLMSARSTKGMIGYRDEKQGLVTLVYIVNAHLGFGSSLLLSFVFFPIWILLPCFWIFHNLFPCSLPALAVLLSSVSMPPPLPLCSKMSVPSVLGNFWNKLMTVAATHFTSKASRAGCVPKGNWKYLFILYKLSAHLNENKNPGLMLLFKCFIE